MSTDFKQDKKEVTIDSLKQKEAKYDRLYGIDYYEGGGMEGRTERLSLQRNEDGKPIIVSELCQHFSLPDHFFVYEADEKLYEDAEAYIREYNLSVWDELEESELFAMDAPSRSLTMRFCDEEGDYADSVTIDFDDVFPEGGHEVVWTLIRMFTPYMEKEKLIDHYVMADEEKISSGKEIENDENQIRELIRGYWNDGGSYAYLDPEDELLLFDLGGIEKREYDMKQIVHEAYGEHEAKWYLIYVNREDENDTVCITMDQGTLYLEDLNGNTFFGKLN